MKVDDIKTIVCIGAGVIGHSWACAFAQRGYSVRLIDINKELLAAIPEKVRSNYEVFVKKGLITAGELEAILGRIERGTDIAWATGEADFCIESVPENMDLKKKIFTEMDQIAPRSSILASSTSSQSMTEIARVTDRPDKCITIHPINPPHIIPAVEVVRGEKTSDETVTLTVSLLRAIGKKPFVCMKEVPGFVVTRLLSIVLREALSLLNRGVATVEDIDTAINAGIGLRFGLMGIFEILNLTTTEGLDTFFERYSPALRSMWTDTDELKDVSLEIRNKAVAGIKDELKGKSREEIMRWRDEKLLELLQIRGLL
jgi:3-hydroxyacyl-CoA dehydrogenase